MKETIQKNIKDAIITSQAILATDVATIEEIAELCCQALKKGGKIIFCGNGGSAADSQHLAAELVVRFKKNRKPVPALALTTNTSILTAIGNDYAFNEIFSRQIESAAGPNDVLIAISTSGASKNILAAVEKARECAIKTIAFTGKQGTQFARLCDLAFIAPHTDTARIQEAHILIGHILCGLIEEELT